jgi:hypothetical protein
MGDGKSIERGSKSEQHTAMRKVPSRTEARSFDEWTGEQAVEQEAARTEKRSMEDSMKLHEKKWRRQRTKVGSRE